MDQRMHDRLRDEAILREQDRASLRKPAHTTAGSPRRGPPSPATRPGVVLVRREEPSRDGVRQTETDDAATVSAAITTLWHLRSFPTAASRFGS